MCFIFRAWCLPRWPAARSADNIGPQVGVIEIYGNHRVSPQKFRAALGITEGGSFPASKGNAEEKLDQISGMVASRLQAACCVQGKMVLYVGIEEKDSPHFEFRPEPTGDITLPMSSRTIMKSFSIQ